MQLTGFGKCLVASLPATDLIRRRQSPGLVAILFVIQAKIPCNARSRCNDPNGHLPVCPDSKHYSAGQWQCIPDDTAGHPSEYRGDIAGYYRLDSGLLFHRFCVGYALCSPDYRPGWSYPGVRGVCRCCRCHVVTLSDGRFRDFLGRSAGTLRVQYCRCAGGHRELVLQPCHQCQPRCVVCGVPDCFLSVRRRRPAHRKYRRPRQFHAFLDCRDPVGAGADAAGTDQNGSARY